MKSFILKTRPSGQILSSSFPLHIRVRCQEKILMLIKHFDLKISFLSSPSQGFILRQELRNLKQQKSYLYRKEETNRNGRFGARDKNQAFISNYEHFIILLGLLSEIAALFSQHTFSFKFYFFPPLQAIIEVKCKQNTRGFLQQRQIALNFKNSQCKHLFQKAS